MLNNLSTTKDENNQHFDRMGKSLYAPFIKGGVPTCREGFLFSEERHYKVMLCAAVIGVVDGKIRC